MSPHRKSTNTSPLSKILVIALFVVLPLIGFYLGAKTSFIAMKVKQNNDMAISSVTNQVAKLNCGSLFHHLAFFETALREVYEIDLVKLQKSS